MANSSVSIGTRNNQRNYGMPTMQEGSDWSGPRAPNGLPLGLPSKHVPGRQRVGMQYTQPQARTFKPGRGISVGEIMSQREGNKNMYYTQTGGAVPQGMPVYNSGWNTSGVGPGTRGYRGSGVIGSAAGAVGSSGVPTSARGKLMKYGADALDEYGQIRTTDDVSDELLENNGLSQSWRYGNMGRPMNRYTNPMTGQGQTKSVRSPQGNSIGGALATIGASQFPGQNAQGWAGSGSASGPMRRLGDMISKYFNQAK